ncbi:conserved hypothetical protein [Catenulispora acidiphila DSM 44928]|uniref:Aminoglycoside phosphotransferase domain-containing protein n=1 Tax=Catenulispora acidiphila (strain DSM 44928 / JCM 14897 / NBRC 102108 / NRRL B-24433 / ID139908) TaxID=479433 RepID=C7PWU4_CATAD|nr:hypothetical protein [Catenulispora acidiphila]ACU77201.1 conserved hypothetical protein [Catenulispora acidiphila DSM 44928]
METTEILAAASAVLGTELTDPVDLGGSHRSTVLRVRTAAGDTVILKAHKEHAAYAAEAGGLRLTDLGPRLLAEDAEHLLIVMEDLGDAPNLADLLLGGDAEQARAALIQWATTYGRLAVQTAGRESELGQASGQWVTEDMAKLPDLLKVLDVAAPPGLAADLDAVTALDHDRFRVFSPGDICPDNNLLTPEGLRPIDFEGAGFHSVFLDASYSRMPFGSCWCVYRLPKSFSMEAERAYRGEVVRVYPELADDRIWRPGVRLASVAYVVAMTQWLMPGAVEEDRPMNRKRDPIASVRQVLRYRWEVTAAALERAEELPAAAAVFRALLARTEDWLVPDLPRYPAFSA